MGLVLVEFPADFLKQVIDAFVHRQQIDIRQRNYMSEVSDISIAKSQTVVIHLIVMSLKVESQPQAPLGVGPKPLAKFQGIYASASIRWAARRSAVRPMNMCFSVQRSAFGIALSVSMHRRMPAASVLYA